MESDVDYLGDVDSEWNTSEAEMPELDSGSDED